MNYRHINLNIFLKFIKYKKLYLNFANEITTYLS